MLEPSADISSINARWLEAGIAVTITIVATPMEMPSADSMARILRVRRPSAPRLSRSGKDSRTGLTLFLADLRERGDGDGALECGGENGSERGRLGRECLEWVAVM
ncbi:hypothetical protein B591_00090 [Streptomyces sp. GBA 94-10 4N24]|nr:hypothetical protein B591_30204 [Streptomyces sp. GBA 94-10 4N24]ESQ01653.1 hypothetical protein B591_00090 [Streptomyces sp. GBA 94-10 4N24]UZN57057.1 hypothetical protein B591N_00090 [Streptomyces sp. GBA 94-10 4N24]UZN63031.1 hypothetical protein B591N_30204 [Streptomyces sp. GBA 94-10 4N24]